MKKIKLSGKRGEGKYALVSDEDFVRLNHYKWNFGSGGYARRTDNKLKKVIMMHREILLVSGKNIVDHINRNTLDNQRNNLRICTRSQNAMNTRKIFKGPVWLKRSKSWQVYITKDYKKIYVGIFKNKADALLAYNKKAKEIYGEFVRLNRNIKK